MKLIFLTYSLLGTSIFLGLFGIVLVYGSRPASIWMKMNSPAISIMMGMALVAYSVFLFVIADQDPVRLPIAIAAIFINIIIALASVAILILYRQSLTYHSTWALLITAIVTGLLVLPGIYGVSQFKSTDFASSGRSM